MTISKLNLVKNDQVSVSQPVGVGHTAHVHACILGRDCVPETVKRRDLENKLGF